MEEGYVVSHALSIPDTRRLGYDTWSDWVQGQEADKLVSVSVFHQPIRGPSQDGLESVQLLS